MLNCSSRIWIPSLNRPCQLHALLESIPAGNFYPYVLYRSDPEYRNGYEKVKSHFSHVEFVEQTDSLISHFLTETISHAHLLTTIITDDCIFWRNIRANLNEIFEVMAEFELLHFSFRLGRNTIIQDLHGFLQPCLRDEIEIKKRQSYIVWDYMNYGAMLNYGYPVCMDGATFMTKDLACLHQVKQFTGIRDWEGSLNGSIRNAYTKKKLGSYSTSCLVNVPVNGVQDPPIPIGYSCRISNEELNRRYLAGETIDLKETFKDVDIRACHQEVKLKFRS